MVLNLEKIIWVFLAQLTLASLQKCDGLFYFKSQRPYCLKVRYLVRDLELQTHSAASDSSSSIQKLFSSVFTCTTNTIIFNLCFGSVFTESGSGSSLLWNTDPFRNQIQTKIYYDKIYTKFIIGKSF
jgi:hypothetical protein